MSKFSRDKGPRGEREFCQKLSEALGMEVTRDLSQCRDGGSDILSIPGFIIEVRRREKLSVDAWWRDVCARPTDGNRLPALAYRQNRQPWRIIVPLACLLPMPVGSEPATLTLRGFVQLVKSKV